LSSGLSSSKEQSRSSETDMTAPWLSNCRIHKEAAGQAASKRTSPQ
jgi:hypothetical protein